MEAIPSKETPPNKNTETANYQILTGFYRAGEHVSDEQVRQEYLKRTRKLIDSIIEEKPDYVIYLDKSARPVSWMVDASWDDFGRGEERPVTKFLNIDREQWRDQVGSSATTVDASRLDSDRIDELRALFSTKHLIDTSLSGRVRHDDALMRSIFDGKKVMIVDEVRSTGDTLTIAKAILRRAFPDAEFVGKYWMTPSLVTLPSGARVNSEVPVWYSEKSVFGRGVANRDSQESARSANTTQRIGRFFLSTRHLNPDEKSAQLRQEIKWLASDRELVEPELEAMRRIQDYHERKSLGETATN